MARQAGLCRVMKWDGGGGGDAATRSHAKGQAGGEVLSLSSESKKFLRQCSEVAIGSPRSQTENGSGDALICDHMPHSCASLPLFLFVCSSKHR